MMVILTIESGQMTGHRVWLNVGQSITIGRDAMSDWPVPSDNELSRKHLSVECQAEQVVVQDLDSLNGVFVNEIQTKEQVVANGDWIRVGNTCLRVEIKDDRQEPQLVVERSTIRDIDALDLEETNVSREPSALSSVVPAAVEDVDQDLQSVNAIVVDYSHEASKRTIWLRPGESLNFGRTDDSDVAVGDPQMSGTHFRLQCDLHECSLRDLKSRNGLFLNELQVRDGARIYNGDTIVAGSTRFSITIDGGRKPPASELRTAYLDERIRKGRQINANFATYMKQDCPTDLTEFADLEGQPPATEVFRRIAKHLQPLLLIDPTRIETVYEVIPGEDTKPLLTWMPDATDFSPRIYLPSDPTRFADVVNSFWGLDGMVCLFCDKHSSETFERLSQLTKMTMPNASEAERPESEQPEQPALYAYYWPSVISVILANDSQFSQELFQDVEAVMVEADDTGAWKIFAKSGFEENLQKIGLQARAVTEEPSPENEPQEVTSE